MDVMLLATLLLAAAALVAAGTLASTLLRPAARRRVVAGAGVVALIVVAAWVVFGFRPSEETGLAAAGTTACLLGALAALVLQPALARSRRIDAGLVEAEELLSRRVAELSAESAAELER